MTTSDQSAELAGRTSALIETRSIDYVPDDERHGKVSHQGPFWFVGNFQPFTLALGFVGPSLGLSLGWTIVAGLCRYRVRHAVHGVPRHPGPSARVCRR